MYKGGSNLQLEAFQYFGFNDKVGGVWSGGQGFIQGDAMKRLGVDMGKHLSLLPRQLYSECSTGLLDALLTSILGLGSTAACKAIDRAPVC